MFVASLLLSGAMAVSGVFQSAAFPVDKIPSVTFPEVDLKCQSTQCALTKEIAELQGKTLRERLDRINAAVNRNIQYTSDFQLYGRKDHWASPNETLARRRGDCEDYAILKMAALKEIGLPADSMSVVVVLDTRRDILHAVLAVATDNGYFILDNLSNQVSLDSTYPNYQPLFSTNTDNSWLHGRVKSRTPGS